MFGKQCWPVSPGLNADGVRDIPVSFAHKIKQYFVKVSTKIARRITKRV